jgi:hypothetical protein
MQAMRPSSHTHNFDARSFIKRHAFCSQFGFDVTLSNFTLGMYFHRGCRGFNGTFAQDCTRPSLAQNPVMHTAVTTILLLLLLAG